MCRTLALAALMLPSACNLDERTLVSNVDAGAPLPGLPDASSSSPVDTGAPPSLAEASAPAPPEDAGTPPVRCPPGVDGGNRCPYTLATNADFDHDVSGWTPDGFASVRWVSTDSSGASGSGSIAVKNAQQQDLDGQSVAGISQCIPATPGKAYDYRAEMFIKAGQVFGAGQVAVWFYATGDCTAVVDQAYAVAGSDVTGKWTIAAGSLIVPQTAHSMSVRLVSQKPYRGGPLEVLFDAVRVTAHK